jgi:hypothetical protein
MGLQLSAREASLVEVIAPTTKIDWSDSWSDEDLEEFTAASAERLESDERR